jgi:exonuclease III
MQKLNLMTFNIEGFGFFFTPFRDETGNPGSYDSAILNMEKYERFLSILEQKTVDVLCLQETAIKEDGYSNPRMTEIYKMIGDRDKMNGIIGNLHQSAICKSHKFTWKKNMHYYGNDSYIANSIYVKNTLKTNPIDGERIISSNSYGMLSPESSPRCFANIQVYLDGIPIHIATVHLLGGRFDDKTAFHSMESMIQEKIYQLNQVISHNPDIICGDFNTKLNMTPEQIESYLNFMITDESEKERIKYEIKNFEQWIVMDIYHQILLQNGYKSIYDDMQINQKDTSVYGGIVDYIYYKPSKLKLVKDSAEIMDEFLGEKERGRYNQTNALSDHSPVFASFTLS